jgi:mycofactocin system transcriptional regulator
MTSVTGARRGAGRPEVTSHAAIEAAAFRLFTERGFDQTTLDAIAEAVGVSRRTLFNYYPSKNDIPWGQFDQTLDHFRTLLRDQPDGLPLWETVHRAVSAFNEFPLDAQPPHVDRMRLILHTPALQSHSVLRHAEWRQVIEEYVADVLGLDPKHPLPGLVGHMSLALALAAYDVWLADPAQSLADVVAEQMVSLRGFLAAASTQLAHSPVGLLNDPAMHRATESVARSARPGRPE